MKEKATCFSQVKWEDLDSGEKLCYIVHVSVWGPFYDRLESITMERITTLETRNLCQSAKSGGCGECQTSCQSACKTSCGVANQKCENK